MRVPLGALLAGLLITFSVTHASAQASGITPSYVRLQSPWVSLPSRPDDLEAAEASPRPRILAASSRSDRRTGTALMIVGAAGIVTGLVVDESIITIAGAGVGGYGLFLYLR